MLLPALHKVVAGENLTAAEAEATLGAIMDGEATEAQIGALLVALRMKGETAEEIAGFARAMRAHCVAVPVQRANVVDTCGTGGDRCDTFNISTTAAFIAAGAGVPIAKHGNRAVSSRCGSADVMAALGIPLKLSPAAVGRCIDEVGLGFLFAPELHRAMKYAIGPRRQLGLRTVFNLLGPLTNPAGARRQVIGVFAGEIAPLVAEALLANGSEHVLVVHGEVGLDEISLCGITQVTELQDGQVRSYTLTAADLGLAEVSLEDLTGGEPADCAACLTAILEGEPGPRREIALANAAAAIYVGGQAPDLAAAVAVARAAVDSGAARQVLENLRRLAGELAEEA